MVRAYVGARDFSPVSQLVAGVLAGAELGTISRASARDDIRLRRTIFRPGGLNDIREPGLANGEGNEEGLSFGSLLGMDKVFHFVDFSDKFFGTG